MKSEELPKERTKSWGYYDNSHVCGECNGNGCRQCFGNLLDPRTGNLWRLRGQGTERFPLSNVVSGCVPPKIGPSWQWQGQGGFIHPFRTTAHKLRKN